MTNTTPNTNVQLTPEQSHQLVVFQTRLSNIQNEVKIASDLLEEKKNDVSRVTKEVAYQQGLLEGVISMLTEKQTSLDSLTNLEKKHSEDLNAIITKSQELSAIHESKGNELNERESILKNREVIHTEKVKELSAREESLSKSEKEIQEKKNKIQSIINTI